MKLQVKFSTYSFIITIAIILALSVIMIHELNSNREIHAYFVAGILVVLCFTSLLYAPMSMSADNVNFYINRSLRIKTIPISDIKSVSLCPPTMSERRICGSGGWFGYWGWFREPSIGKYFAYYGKASDCFLIRLKDGRQYMLGCENPELMVDYLRDKIYHKD